MSFPILSLTIRYEQDTVAARQRTRQIARLLGFEAHDQTRVSTAVSEIARNAFRYANGGKVEYVLDGTTAPQLFIIKISDHGPGIAQLKTILDGRYTSKTGMGLGIIGARRLMDQFEINSSPGQGTTVWLKKLLPKRSRLWKAADLSRVADELARERPQDAFQELQHQNQELVRAMEEIRARQEELMRLNRELEDTNRGVVALYAELDEKADHLRRADEVKSKFLSNMSHEFRSPLNSILALSGLLLDRTDGELTHEQDQQVGFIRTAAKDLLELVNDLLDLAKVEAGKVEIRPLEFEVANLLAALRGMLRPLLLNRSVDLVFEVPDGIPPLYSDEGKISQILRNFLSNALKFTERGEVRVQVLPVGKDEVEFSVRDTGIGIAPEHREMIFEDFVQLDNPIQRKVKGTGLGLPLSRRLAQLLGGDVRVESTVGVGSTFFLRIPILYGEPPAEKMEGPVARSAEPSGLPVLFIEDSEDMILAYRSYLNGTGFSVVPASTVREAEKVLERLRPRAIVLDIILRAEDTWSFLSRVKTDPAIQDIPVIILSTLEDRAKGYHLGAASYLTKPVDRAQLVGELSILTGEPPLNQILIIDDNEMDRYLLKQQLRKLSVLINEAPSGVEGLRKARELQPKVIFLDLVMPGSSGFETLDELKSDPALRDIPVVVATSLVLRDDERVRLVKKAVAIVHKDKLAQTDIAELLRSLVNERTAKAG
jgi:signal transduction histidine kinase/CheY-like chemotaxis protein